ncbi:MAG: DNA methyltransferase C1 [Candidatus Thorarchaeota archaeon]|nr:MAG: DNA methyltransferase C1 [Candidatus Thorarchaeota archaeon]
MDYEHIQTTLDGKTSENKFLSLLKGVKSFSESLDALDHIDWDFSGFTTQYLTHKFHSYPARFIPQIPLSFIRLFTKPNDSILDPFCGCGTSLVEAFLHERNSIGNDFNPLAALISKVKVTLVPQKELKYLQKKVKTIDKMEISPTEIDHISERLPSRKISSIFSESVIYELSKIKEMIQSLRENHRDIFDIGRIALSSTIWSIVENNGVKDIGNLFRKRIDMIMEELRSMDRLVSSPPDCLILSGDARKLEVPDDVVKLVITSPPYVNALDYYRIHMYNMFWLDMDFGLFRKHEIGAHSHYVANRFRLLTEYLADMLRAMIEMNRVMKIEGICAIVVGNSSLEYELIESYKHFSSFAPEIGFKIQKTIYRNIDTKRKYTSTDIGNIDDEYILVLQKKSSCPIPSTDNEFVTQIVSKEMEKFQKQVNSVQGTSITGRKPTKERLRENIERIAEAITHLPKDIKMKK